jgi:hypothetical protein
MQYLRALTDSVRLLPGGNAPAPDPGSIGGIGAVVDGFGPVVAQAAGVTPLPFFLSPIAAGGVGAVRGLLLWHVAQRTMPAAAQAGQTAWGDDLATMRYIMAGVSGGMMNFLVHWYGSQWGVTPALAPVAVDGVAAATGGWRVPLPVARAGMAAGASLSALWWGRYLWLQTAASRRQDAGSRWAFGRVDLALPAAAGALAMAHAMATGLGQRAPVNFNLTPGLWPMVGMLAASAAASYTVGRSLEFSKTRAGVSLEDERYPRGVGAEPAADAATPPEAISPQKAIVALLSPPIVEETMYRLPVLLIASLLPRWRSAHICAGALTSLAFGILHVQNPDRIRFFWGISSASMADLYVSQALQSGLPAIIVQHLVHNLLSVMFPLHQLSGLR